MHACKRGQSELVISIPAKIAVQFESLFPEMMSQCLEKVRREILLSRNFEGTQPYIAGYLHGLHSSFRGIMFAMRDKRGERSVRTVEKQTVREFVVLN